MKKLISPMLLIIASAMLLSACSAKSFTLSNIKRHLGMAQPTPEATATPIPTTVVRPTVTVMPTIKLVKAVIKKSK